MDAYCEYLDIGEKWAGCSSILCQICQIDDFFRKIIGLVIISKLCIFKSERKLNFKEIFKVMLRAHIDLTFPPIYLFILAIFSAPCTDTEKWTSRPFYTSLTSDDRIFKNRWPRPSRESPHSNLADTYFVFWSSFRFSLKAPSFIVFIPTLS